MHIGLEAKLRSRYPAIFANWNKPTSESGMSLGVQCGDGWFDIIDGLCRALQALADDEGVPPVVAVQVKQKFGTLRFHTDDELSDQQAELIHNAHAQSALTCEECGLPGRTMTLNRRQIATRCAVHAAVGREP